jgi:hypothetical protein
MKVTSTKLEASDMTAGALISMPEAIAMQPRIAETKVS